MLPSLISIRKLGWGGGRAKRKKEKHLKADGDHPIKSLNELNYDSIVLNF
jgi:hypothetical protein